MKKEIGIYLIILLLLAIIQHPDILINPSERILNLSNAIVYGMGAIHPFVFAFVGYIIIGIFRLIIVKPILKMVSKKY